MRIMAKQSRLTVTPGSGNVFADLGFAEPGEELAEAQRASLIGHVIKKRRLTQAAAAALMGVDQPKVPALLNGRIASFSSERLMRLLTALGRDIDIIVRRSSGRRVEGRIRVMEEAHS
jgi:predicted XRE-type DNA-binding protein